MVSFVLKLYICDEVFSTTINVSSLAEFTFKRLIETVRDLAPDFRISRLTWRDVEGDLVTLQNGRHLTEALSYLHRVNGTDFLRIHANVASATEQSSNLDPALDTSRQVRDLTPQPGADESSEECVFVAVVKKELQDEGPVGVQPAGQALLTTHRNTAESNLADSSQIVRSDDRVSADVGLRISPVTKRAFAQRALEVVSQTKAFKIAKVESSSPDHHQLSCETFVRSPEMPTDSTSASCANSSLPLSLARPYSQAPPIGFRFHDFIPPPPLGIFVSPGTLPGGTGAEPGGLGAAGWSDQQLTLASSLVHPFVPGHSLNLSANANRGIFVSSGTLPCGTGALPAGTGTLGWNDRQPAPLLSISAQRSMPEHSPELPCNPLAAECFTLRSIKQEVVEVPRENGIVETNQCSVCYQVLPHDDDEAMATHVKQHVANRSKLRGEGNVEALERTGTMWAQCFYRPVHPNGEQIEEEEKVEGRVDAVGFSPQTDERSASNAEEVTSGPTEDVTAEEEEETHAKDALPAVLEEVAALEQAPVEEPQTVGLDEIDASIENDDLGKQLPDDYDVSHIKAKRRRSRDPEEDPPSVAQRGQLQVVAEPRSLASSQGLGSILPTRQVVAQDGRSQIAPETSASLGRFNDTAEVMQPCTGEFDAWNLESVQRKLFGKSSVPAAGVVHGAASSLAAAGEPSANARQSPRAKPVAASNGDAVNVWRNSIAMANKKKRKNDGVFAAGNASTQMFRPATAVLSHGHGVMNLESSDEERSSADVKLSPAVLQQTHLKRKPGRPPRGSVRKRNDDYDEDYVLGQLVFAFIKGYPPWPGRIQKPMANLTPPKARPHYVFFYGTHQTAFLAAKDLCAYDENAATFGQLRRKGQHFWRDFNRALWELVNDREVSPDAPIPKDIPPEQACAAALAVVRHGRAFLGLGDVEETPVLPKRSAVNGGHLKQKMPVASCSKNDLNGSNSAMPGTSGQNSKQVISGRISRARVAKEKSVEKAQSHRFSMCCTAIVAKSKGEVFFAGIQF